MKELGLVTWLPPLMIQMNKPMGLFIGDSLGRNFATTICSYYVYTEKQNRLD